MDKLIFHIRVNEDRRVVIDLPPDVPLGEFDVELRPKQPIPTSPTGGELTREEVRARMLAAGILATDISKPLEARELTPNEVLTLGRAPAGSKTSDQMIDEDRGEF